MITEEKKMSVRTYFRDTSGLTRVPEGLVVRSDDGKVTATIRVQRAAEEVVISLPDPKAAEELLVMVSKVYLTMLGREGAWEEKIAPLLKE